MIPPLGQHYLEAWAEEDRGLPSSRSQSPVLAPSSSGGASLRYDSHDGNNDGRLGLSSLSSNGHLGSHYHDRLKYFSPNETLTDDYLLTEDLTCGTLTERLISSLVTEDVGVDSADLESYVASSHDGSDDGGGDDDDDYSNVSEGRTIVELSTRPPDEVVDFEERLKRELRYAGLFGDDEVNMGQRGGAHGKDLTCILHTCDRWIGMQKKTTKSVLNCENCQENSKNRWRSTNSGRNDSWRSRIASYNMNSTATCSTTWTAK